MRISLLEERENFDKILKNTLENSTFFENQKNIEMENFFINKYMNFIVNGSLPADVFQTLVNEYSTSLIWWRKWMQLIYVRLATSLLLRKLFSQRKIVLPRNLKNYLILGGNHRIRLFRNGLKDSIVILKSGENKNFIRNDIFLRNNYNLTYAPKIIDSGIDWLKEEYFNGNPLNRIATGTKLYQIKNLIIKNHTKELIKASTEEIFYEDYKKIINTEVIEILKNKEIKFKEELSISIKKVINSLFEVLLIDKIKISWTHGDFQEANILISKNNYKVIDWEASDKRYYLYDELVLLSKIRSNISIEESIYNLNKTRIEEKKIGYCKNTIILFLIEEIRFYLKEDFSINFYSCGKKTELLCNSIEKFINEK
jgi:hypothetical protein